MKRFFLTAATAFCLAAPVAAAAHPPAPAQPSDWSRRIEATTEGGYRMGNPDAPVKLVEFLSLTCGHCATFSHEAMPALRAQVRAGGVSIEYRNYVLNPYDVAAAILSRCTAPDRYFDLTDALLARQETWAGRIDALTPQQRAQVEVNPTPASIRRTVELLGLKEIAAAHGVSAARARTCLADATGLNQVIGMLRAAEAQGIDGTPSFMLNGRVIGAQDWSSLRPLLVQAASGQP